MMDRVKLTAALAAAAILSVLAPSGAGAQRPAPPTPLERALDELGARSGGSLILDAALHRVATAHATSALNGAADEAGLRMALWDHGVRDAEARAIVLTTNRPVDARAARAALGAAQLDVGWFDHGGVGEARDREGFATVFVFTRRTATFLSEGLVQLRPDAVAPRLVITDEGGGVRHEPLTPAGPPGRWRLLLEPDRTGARLVELESTGDGGLTAVWIEPRLDQAPDAPPRPESPAAEPDHLGLGPHGLGGPQAGPGVPTSSPRDRVQEDVAAAERFLRRALSGRRAVAGRPSGVSTARLEAAARAGASAALREAPIDRALIRLVASGASVSAALEARGVAASPLLAWAHLIADPEARAVILGAGDLAAAGAVSRLEAGDRRSFAVSVIVASSGPAPTAIDPWGALVRAQLGEDRAAAGLPQLLTPPALDAIAADAARLLRGRSDLALSSEEQAALVEAARRARAPVRSIAIDVLVTTDPAALRGRRYTGQAQYGEAGIGVVGPAEQEDTLIVVLVFVAR